jgi:site-specific DNA-methyltransferase (adenine-specific)
MTTLTPPLIITTSEPTTNYSDDWLTIYQGDARAVLHRMPAESVHCVVTSPPYWGLRDYGTATWEGGDAGCDHRHQLGGEGESSAKQNTSAGMQTVAYRDVCRKCGATRLDAQLGLERTPEEYVAAMVDVFREVRRVLRDDGTLWLNLGDSYNNTDKWGGGQNPGKHTIADDGHVPSHDVGKRKPPPSGLKPKDLVGIPWRVAFALQADGWYLRSDIIWSKPQAMPESVTDRPTKSHEYLFLLAKSARYYFDAEAVRERAESGPSDLRNIRTVWTIATAPYPGAHFATFPPKLVEPCVKAGCPAGGVVLDPFAGTGTVGMVAQQLSRRAVLIDLNAEYLAQCLARNAQTPLGLEVTA